MAQSSPAARSRGIRGLLELPPFDAAVVWRRSNEARPAAAAERRAAELVSRCEGASTPALQAIGTRAQLTPVERQVALLAAGGRSNKQIAQELFLATRTVENHLQHVYEKLGITGRTGLAEALDATGASAVASRYSAM